MHLGNCQTIGTCSICGGPVQVPLAWWSVVPPTPTCGSCGAMQRQSFGPVIDMQPAPQSFTTTTLILGGETSQERHQRRYRRQWRDLKIKLC
jgi:hypothetical protein